MMELDAFEISSLGSLNHHPGKTVGVSLADEFWRILFYNELMPAAL